MLHLRKSFFPENLNHQTEGSDNAFDAKLYKSDVRMIQFHRIRNAAAQYGQNLCGIFKNIAL